LHADFHLHLVLSVYGMYMNHDPDVKLQWFSKL